MIGRAQRQRQTALAGRPTAEFDGMDGSGGGGFARGQIHQQAGVASPERTGLEGQYTALGNPEQAFTKRVTDAHDGFDKLDDQATEIDQAISSSEAMAVAMRKYASDVLPTDQRTSIQQQLDEVMREAGAEDLKRQIDDALNVDPRHEVEKAITGTVDPEGEINRVWNGPPDAATPTEAAPALTEPKIASAEPSDAKPSAEKTP